MTWRPDGPQGNEAAKVRWDIVPYTGGRVLDLGCGPFKAFPHFIGVDSCKDTTLFGTPMAPDVVVDSCEQLADFEDETCDAVFSSHLLEHIKDPGSALAEWWRVIKPGGYLVLYLPHAELYPRCGHPMANPDHKHDFMPRDIFNLMEYRCISDWGRNSFEFLVNETRNEGDEYSFLQVYRKVRLRAGVAVDYDAPSQRPEKTACVVRYGGFGDQIQAANILPELKRQGYHVTMMTTPKGMDILRLDPHVDGWLLQGQDQVPNQCLSEYWAHWAKKFDRFINLSESVEATLLAIPGRTNHLWPDAVRRKYMGINYLEWTAELAELPYTSEARFYASEEETNAVLGLTEHYGGPHTFHVMFALAGSSIHKFYPGQDIVITALLNLGPNIHVYLVGDEACKILEAGWEDHPQVTCLSGELDIRGTLALAQVVDCVIGPETGVLNAVAFEEHPKIVMLSHSTHENLTKHWVNTAVIAPNQAVTPCYPCHRLHYGREWCPEDPETGAAVCQASIPPVVVFNELAGAYGQWGIKRDAERTPRLLTASA